jgi:hypothetical protein
MPVGAKHKTPEDIARCLATWATDHGSDTMFNSHCLQKLLGDADETCFSIHGTFAAPTRHQEQNEICERAWQSGRDVAFKTVVFAHVGDEFFDFAIENARKL